MSRRASEKVLIFVLWIHSFLRGKKYCGYVNISTGLPDEDSKNFVLGIEVSAAASAKLKQTALFRVIIITYINKEKPRTHDKKSYIRGFYYDGEGGI